MTEKYYKCNACGSIYRTILDINRHIDIVHGTNGEGFDIIEEEY